MEVSPRNDKETPREARRRLGLECAQRLIAARLATGKTEADCANALGVARSTWQEWEGGAIPDAVRGGRIEDMLGVARGGIYRDGEVPESATADGPVVVREGYEQPAPEEP